MYVKVVSFIVLISSVICDPRRVPKIYNAVITSSDNLEPSKAYPIIQPVIQPAAIAYQVHLPYIPNGAYPNYLQQHIHPDFNPYTINHQPEFNQHVGQTYQSNPQNSEPANIIQNVPQRGNVLESESPHDLVPEAPINVQASQYEPNLQQSQYQPPQPNIIQAKAILPSRANPPVQIPQNYQHAQQSSGVNQQEVQNVAQSVAYQNVNQPTGNNAGGMPQYGDILNNHFRHKYPDIPDVPPPPLPTNRRKTEGAPPPNVQQANQ